MRKITCLFVMLINSCGFLLMSAPPDKTIRNSIHEIEGKMGRIILELAYIWGDSGDDEYIFKTPSDITIDGNGHVYISDSDLHCINVFDTGRKFVRRIGKRGQGPGDIITPLRLAVDSKNDLWVYEFGNRRIQVFSETGETQFIVKLPDKIDSNMVFPEFDHIACYNFSQNRSGQAMITMIDRTGAIVKTIGKNMLPPEVDLPWAGGKNDTINISYNHKTKEFVALYKYSQMIQLFKNDGELSSCIFYDTLINKELKMTWDPKKRNYDLSEKKKNYSEGIDIALDNSGRFFIVASTRLPDHNEGTSMIFIPGGNIVQKPLSKEYPEKTDMYRLMVFATSGEVIAAEQLDVFCDGIYIRDNRLFIIDKTFAKVIYEYRYKFSD